MKHRSQLLIAPAALAVLAAAVGTAFATDPSGVTPTPHVTGADLPVGVNINADHIKFQTKDPADVSVVTLTIEPLGTTGWHSHPGLALIAVAEGTGKLYSADCTAQTFSAGQAFVESGDDAPTVFRNESSVNRVVLTVTFVAPADVPVLRDAANPGCPVS